MVEPLLGVLQLLETEWRKRRDIKFDERRELEVLERELRMVHAFLKSSANIQSERSQLLMERERQIRELAYEVEDTIETCLVKKAAARSRNIVIRSIKWLNTNMAKKVKSLREKKVKRVIDMIEEDFGKIHVESSTMSSEVPLAQVIIKSKRPMDDEASTSQGMRAHYQPKELHKVVEFEDEATIMGYLMEPNDRLDVISITGMPGLGKTTLARKIFLEERISHRFEVRIWLHVSQKFNSKDAFLKILEMLLPRGMPIQSDQDLAAMISRSLEYTEFLLVIDDVWTIEDWEVIQRILPQQNIMSKVLVTSRQREVAVQANIYRQPHELSLMRHDKSLELLKLNVFGDLGGCPPELEDIGQEIANKCGGLPLSLVVIGGILKNLFTKTRAIVGLQEEWSKVLENVDHILQEDKDKTIANVLKLSYNMLPGDLKLCFLFTGLFRDDHDISVSTLTQLWIEEGFVQAEEAEEFLEHLINMNLIMVKRKVLDQVTKCRVHDMIREFCRAKAVEEKLFTIIRESKEGVIDQLPGPGVHRLCLHSDPSKFLSAEPEGSSVRSFICLLEEPVDLDPAHVSAIPNAFSELRILSCKSIRFGEFPKLTSLILLKHITLWIDDLHVVPKQVSRLLNLRTLVVDTNSPSITIKANIWRMVQLRQLRTNATFVLDDEKWRGKGCRNLETISWLSPKSCKPTLSERAPNLKTLGIRGEVASLFNDTFSLKNFLLLKKLKLENESSLHPLVLPHPDCFPPNLNTLTLSNTQLNWNLHMPALAMIKSLKVLKLKDDAFVGTSWDDVGDGFEKLQLLLINNTKLVFWKASSAHFPRLRSLVLKSCERLREIPVSLATNLENLELEKVSEQAADSARTIHWIRSKEKAIQLQQSISGVPFNLTIN